MHSHNLLIFAARSSRSLASSFFESSILCGLIRCFADVPAHPSTTHAYSSARQKVEELSGPRSKATDEGRPVPQVQLGATTEGSRAGQGVRVGAPMTPYSCRLSTLSASRKDISVE